MNTAQKDGECCICLEDFEASHLGRQWLSCGHVFHEQCVTQMRARGGSDRCPVCRERQSELTPLQVLLDEALLCLGRGEFSECAKFASKALDVEPENPYVCALLADRYHLGDGLPQDVERAKELYKIADRGGDLDGTLNLGGLWLVEGNVNEAKKCYMKLHRAGDSRGAFQLGVLCQQEGHAKQARQYYELAHQGGDKSALYNLGTLCLEEDRFTEARKLWKEAWAMGCADAAMKLGLLSELDDNIGTAMQWYLKAHLHGSIEGTYMLGRLYEDQGNIELARECYHKASMHGHQDAAKHLALLDQGPEMQMKDLINRFAKFVASHEGPKPSQGLDVGVRVKVFGLTSGVGKELNDCMGTVMSHDPCSGRYGVQVDGWKGTKALKPENLVRAMQKFPEQSQSEFDPFDVDELAAQPALWNSANSSNIAMTSIERESEVNEQVSSAILHSKNTEKGLKVLVLRFSRSSRAFRDALLQSPELEDTRNALEQFGYSVELESGAKVFVRPDIYQPVLRAIRLGGWVLYPEHVIVETPELEDAVIQLAKGLPKKVTNTRQNREKVLPRGATAMPLAFAAAAENLECDVSVSKTFLHVQVPSSMRSSEGDGQPTVSTTQTSPRKGKNHRKKKSHKVR